MTTDAYFWDDLFEKIDVDFVLLLLLFDVLRGAVRLDYDSSGIPRIESHSDLGPTLRSWP